VPDLAVTTITSEDGLWDALKVQYSARLGQGLVNPDLYSSFQQDYVAWKSFAAGALADTSWFGRPDYAAQAQAWEPRRVSWAAALEQSVQTEAKKMPQTVKEAGGIEALQVPAVLKQRQEVAPPPGKPAIDPLWVGLGLGSVALLSLGYVLASVAKLGGRS
jgi:hypothetical protein